VIHNNKRKSPHGNQTHCNRLDRTGSSVFAMVMVASSERALV